MQFQRSFLSCTEFSKLLHDYESLPAEIRPAALKEVALEVLSINSEVNKGKLPKDSIRQVRHDAEELNRIVNLINLHWLKDTILETDQQLRTLREFISTGLKEEAKEVSKVSSLIARAISNLTGFAKNRGVQIRKRTDAPDVSVMVVEREVIRALANILHNAIKYSWTRGESGNPWVMIRVFTGDDVVHFEFENYGVPIPKDEIEQGLIFEIGYRGRLSSDRGRVGTGIGLADARQVARSHGGHLTVISRPAVFGRADDDYRQPFITTVTFSLPIYHPEGKSHES